MPTPERAMRQPWDDTGDSRPAPVQKTHEEKSPEETPSADGALGLHGHWLTSPRVLLAAALVIGAISHGYHLFQYPLYITDEGIYMQQAWAILRERALSPYTYFYDHAPAGWLVLAAWVQILPGQFQTFGNAINTGRALMLLVHLASIFFLFQITFRLSGSRVAAFIACFFFSVSPLAVFYQRQVLLDNIMVFWLLLSLYLIVCFSHRLLAAMISGLALGMAVLTKENGLFFVPAFAYLLFRQVRSSETVRFTLNFWSLAALGMVSLYFLYATLKNELFPSGFSFDLSAPPADHVSLLYTIWWQFHRSQGSVLDPNSLFWQFSLGRWLPLDMFIIAAGTAAIGFNLLIGLRDRKRNFGPLVAGLAGASYILYLARGSMILDFYVVPLLPFLAMNIGLVAARIIMLPALSVMVRRGAVLGLIGFLILNPMGGYVLAFNDRGILAPKDLYVVPLTSLQAQQLAFIRKNIPPDARIIMDDDLWVSLHDSRPYYRFAHSHWKASSDPDVRDKLFAKDWNRIDYFVMSNKMLVTMQQNNEDGRYNWIIEGLNRSQRIWVTERGDVKLEIYQVHGGRSG